MTRYFMYVLACHDKTLYTGYTTDPDRREKQHQNGKGAKYTKPSFRRPCKMIFVKEYPTQTQAMQAEYHFKQLSRPQKESYLARYGQNNYTEQSNRVTVGLEGEKDA